MTKYYVEVQQTFTATYEVDADNENEALLKYEQGEAISIDNEDDEFVDVWPADL